MLHRDGQPSKMNNRFDLAPTGALCYSGLVIHPPGELVLISLPQERCATHFGWTYPASPTF